MSEERFKILVYQYMTFKADYYNQKAKSALAQLRYSKELSAEDLHQIYIDLLTSELFDKFVNELYNLIKYV